MFSQEERDVSYWAAQKLRQWFRDVHMRFDVIEAEPHTAMASIVMDLMLMAAALLADTNADADTAGRKLASLIREMRDEQSRRRDRG